MSDSLNHPEPSQASPQYEALPAGAAPLSQMDSGSPMDSGRRRVIKTAIALAPVVLTVTARRSFGQEPGSTPDQSAGDGEGSIQ